MPRPRFIRVNVDDPESLKAMLRSGTIWQFPALWQKGIDAINKGLVPVAECKDIPAEAMAAISVQ